MTILDNFESLILLQKALIGHVTIIQSRQEISDVYVSV